ncbi:MAG: asparagine synthase-related protein, partial [Candidatus Omnitrophica bacterium]|nr:asparagine synthase-related protein [Candidatus Omnitrophota bacterium]
VKNLHTFSIGVRNSPDLENARMVADHIKSEHHEVVVDFDQIVSIIPDVIYHLESFDAFLVRSSIINFIMAGLCSNFVEVVYSGECSDELFGGYEYLKKIELSALADELFDIIGRLHNTALQRVDRSASSHGLVIQIPFANPEVVDYALKIPAKFKIQKTIEKWILRKAFNGMLPENILNRTKAKFWEGAGIGETILRYAEKQISDSEFQKEYKLQNGWELVSKEELFYYRTFREKFDELQNLSWIGRTKHI